MKPVQLAVVTGKHPYDVVEFQRLFRSFPEVDFYPQSMEAFAASDKAVRQGYDVVVFYHFIRPTPGEAGDPIDSLLKSALEDLGETRQGIFVLHHAILSFPLWQVWSDLTGISERSHSNLENQTVRSEVVNPSHPITRGLASWEMVDETYLMKNPNLDCCPLLTTRHPLSMRILAWTKTYRQGRVLCYQSGHDQGAYRDPFYRQFIRQGIVWLAGREKI